MFFSVRIIAMSLVFESRVCLVPLLVLNSPSSAHELADELTVIDIGLQEPFIIYGYLYSFKITIKLTFTIFKIFIGTNSIFAQIRIL